MIPTDVTHPHRPWLRGALTALVTPFTADGRLDEAGFRRLVRWQILAGIDGLVPCGTTGESPTLTSAEREWLIGTTVEIAAGTGNREFVGLGQVQEHRGDVPPFTARRAFPVVVGPRVDEGGKFGVLLRECDEDVLHAVGVELQRRVDNAGALLVQVFERTQV